MPHYMGRENMADYNSDFLVMAGELEAEVPYFYPVLRPENHS